MPVVLALASAAVFGAADFAGGYATRRLPVLTVTLTTNLVGAVLAALLVIVVGGSASAASLLWGAAAGFFGLAGIMCLYQGLAQGPNRLVSPLSALLSALIPVVAGLVGGDRLDTLAIIGLVLAGPAIWLVAGGDHRMSGSRSTLTLAVVAGLGFGLFFVCLAQTPDDAGAVPLLAARIVSTCLLAAAVLHRGIDIAQPGNLAMPALAGVLDMSANGLYLWATRDGELAVVAALTSLYPVTTILLATAILRERVTRPQAVGLVLAVSAAALLS